MNYNKTINLAQKAETMGNCINHLTSEIVKDGITQDDMNWILARIDEIKQYQVDIQTELNEQVEVDKF